MKKVIFVTVLSVVSLVASAQISRYVTQTGAGNRSGTSWADASDDLQLMMNEASQCKLGTVRVAAGTYTPKRPADNLGVIDQLNPNNAFVAQPSVQVFGGYSDTAPNEPRDWVKNKTILSGTLSSSAYCHRVLLSVGNMWVGFFDGFIVQNPTPTGAVPFSDPDSIIVNGDIIRSKWGNGVVLCNSNNSLMHFIIRNCDDAGIYMTNNSGLFISSSLIHSNAGGIKCFDSDVSLSNTTISKNNAGYWTFGIGNGIHCENSSSQLYDCIIYDNKGYGSNPGVEVQGINSTIVYDRCLVKGITQADANGNLDGSLDPLFINPAINNFALAFESPCIDKGHSGNYADIFDLTGNDRKIGNYTDLGAYEFPIPRVNNKILFVNKDVNGGTGDGSSWANAMPNLSHALLLAKFNPSIEEIWVSGNSTYSPEKIPYSSEYDIYTNVYSKFFVLSSGISLYGGFPDTANDTYNAPFLTSYLSSLTVDEARNTRNWQLYPTILDGQNAYHVVVAAACTDTSMIDGFTVTGGNADGSGGDDLLNGYSVNHSIGGGISIYGSNLKLQNLIIEQNTAYRGGGLYANFSTLIMNNVNIDTNKATFGGGLYLSSSTVHAVKTNIFQNKTYSSGGGAYIESSRIKGMSIYDNTATQDGGGIYNAVSQNNTRPTLENVAVFNNKAIGGFGGGILSYFIQNNLTDTFVNLTVCNNKTPDNVNKRNEGISNKTSWGTYTLNIYNSVIAYNWTEAQTSNIKYSNCYYSDFYLGSTNLFPTANPAFIDTAAGNYRLRWDSDLVDNGDNKFLSSDNTQDADSNERIFNDIVDIGAYEHILIAMHDTATGILYVDSMRNGNGSSWRDALSNFADALKYAEKNPDVKQIWVARGTYYPKHRAANTTVGGIKTDLLKSFVMVENLKCYGGFAGWEDNINQRKLRENPTILSGQLGGGYVFHVVIYAGTGEQGVGEDDRIILSETILNGFIIEKGRASMDINNYDMYVNGALIKADRGAGIYNQIIYPEYNSFRKGQGLIIEHCIIRDNIAKTVGSGIYNSGDFYIPPPPIIGITWYKTNLSSISNSLICGNTGDGIYNNGYIEFEMYASTIAGNDYGIFFNDNNQYAHIRSSIIKKNGNGTDFKLTAGVFLASIDIFFSLIGGITAEGPNSHGTDANGTYYRYEGNLNSGRDPLFTNDYHLQFNSPCLNRSGLSLHFGDNGGMGIPDTLMDLDGNPRSHHGTADMGCYERNVIPDVDGIVYVDSGVVGGSNLGTDWANAVPDLAFALVSAQYDTNIRKIFTAKGTYLPKMFNLGNLDYTKSTNDIDPNTIHAQSFILPENVEIYGGFESGETDISQRNWTANPTVLSGAVRLNSDRECGSHVVVSLGNSAASILDGFYITQGFFQLYRTRNYTYHLPYSGPYYSLIKDCGSGVYNEHSNTTYRNLIIENNNFASLGGGMFNIYSDPLLENVTLRENTASQGAGIFNDYAQPTINNSQIISNHATDGGGVFNYRSDPQFSNVQIKNNSVSNNGGGMHNEESSPILQTVNFMENFADWGGGLYNDFLSTPVLNQINITGNQAHEGGGVYNASASLILDTVNIFDNSADDGGGWYNKGTSNLQLKNTQIYHNQAHNGGGVYITGAFAGRTRLNGATIRNNIARNDGGGIYLGEFGRTDIFNCNISYNDADNEGGGICQNTSSTDSVRLINVLLNDNYALRGGAASIRFGTCDMINVTAVKNRNYACYFQAINNSAILNIYNSIIYGNNTMGTASNFLNTFIDYSLVQDLPAALLGNKNLPSTTNPQFVNPNNNFQLNNGSPCRNKGNNAYFPSYITEDLAGNPRIVSTIDMGAYENQAIVYRTLYVKAGGAGSQDGSNWANAMPEFSDALQIANADPSVTQIWVADGVYSLSTIYTRDTSYILPPNVKIYGGFPSNANDISHSALGSRPVNNNNFGQTILDGSGCYHVVIAGKNSHLDGFVIENGNADNLLYGEYGGGILVSDSADLQHLEVRYNQGIHGAAIAVTSGCPQLKWMQIYNNNAQSQGGGIYCENANLYAKKLNIYDNSANRGGGIYCFDNGNSPYMPVFESVSIHQNNAGQDGGGIYNDGATPLFLNTLIYGNSGGSSSAVYNGATSTILFVHATISDQEIVQGGNFYAENSILCLNSPAPSGNSYYANGNCDYLFIDANNGNYSLEPSAAASLTTPAVNLTNLVQNIYPNILLSGLCVSISTMLQTDMADNPRRRMVGGQPQSYFGAYEHGYNNPPFNPSKPWKSASYGDDNDNDLFVEQLQSSGAAKLQVYPNPTTGQLKIKNYELKENTVIEIYNVVGQKVGAYPCGRPETTINVQHLANGMYYIKVNERVSKFVKMSD